MTLANNKFGRAAANVDNQTFVGRGREFVGYARVDKASFFGAGDHLDGKAQCGLGARQNFCNVASYSKSVGGYSPNTIGVEAFQALAVAL